MRRRRLPPVDVSSRHLMLDHCGSGLDVTGLLTVRQVVTIALYLG